MNAWLSGSATFDVAIACFEDEPDHLKQQADYFLARKGFKTDNFLAMLARFPELGFYDYILFIDDDIVITPDQLDDLFMTARQFDLDICQPALTSGSVYSWQHTCQDLSKRLQFTNLVEIQCFCLSRKLLTLALPYLPLIKTGWGLDLIFWELLGKPEDKMAIVHSIGMLHPRRHAPRMYQRISDFTEVSRKVEIELSRKLGKGSETLVDKFQLLLFGSIANNNTKIVSPTYPHYTFTEAEEKLFLACCAGATNMLEYGSGWSTVTASRLVNSVTSIEHDADYYEKLIPDLPGNVDLVLARPDVTYTSFDKFGGDWNLLNMDEFLEKDGTRETFKSYIEAPASAPYDLILIDGRSRIYCAQHVYQNRLLTDDGVLLVHDYERRWYQAMELWFEPVKYADRLVQLKWR